MTEEGRLIATALARRVDARLKALPNVSHKTEFASPNIRVENLVESPEVHNNVTVPPAEVQVVVDMTPVAEALREQGRQYASALAGFAAALDRLAKAITENGRPQVTVQSAVPEIRVEAPVVTLPERKPVAFRLVTDRNGDKRAVPENA